MPWSKTDSNPPPLPHGDPPGEIQDLFRHLRQLGEQLEHANRQVAEYLLRRESPSAPAPPAGDGAAAGLAPRLEELGARIDGLGRRQEAICEQVRQLQDQLDRGFQQMAELLGPRAEPLPALPRPEVTPQPALSGFDWERAVLGPDLAGDSRLGFQRQQLLRGVLDGDPGARALAGQLLIFHASPPERLPQLLKDIGEAYYRWQPKTRPGATPFESALASWLQRACEAVGLRNTIELVDPGGRFDTTRHNADSRGVEIVEVRGWIVLRDNGKVYTRANVGVR
jgi:hypothetical protein